jgi:hypothetical protein
MVKPQPARTPFLHGWFLGCSTLFSGMFHGYRRWMTLFNAASIVLSVTLALVILGFAHGVRIYVDDMVRKEAAAGAVRVNLSGWQPEGAAVSFADRMREVDLTLRAAFSGNAYRSWHLWWRSEAHFLMLGHPADEQGRGIFAKLGNTIPGDPEAQRVAPFAVAGSWVTDGDAAQIVLSAPAALKLAKRLPDSTGVADLVGRTIWIALPGTGDHAPAACAQVTVTGVFDHMRDAACMTTPGVIQQMFARVKANANGRWYETYDRLSYRVEGLDLPLVCWRTRDYSERWIRVPPSPHLADLKMKAASMDVMADWLAAFAGAFADEEKVKTMAEQAATALELDLDVNTLTHRAAFDAASAQIAQAVKDRHAALVADIELLEQKGEKGLGVRPDGIDTVLSVQAPQRVVLPPSDRTSLADPDAVVVCSPRVWDELGFQVAPLLDVEPWDTQALYAYLYFRDLATAGKARGMLEQWGFATYMPIDQFRGLVSLVELVSWGAFGLLAMVLLAGTLGIAITLYTEVDAEQGEIGLLKALGASNKLVAWAFLGKGALIGLVGVVAGVPLAAWVGRRINLGVSSAIADTAGLNEATTGFFTTDVRMLAVVCAGIVLLSAAAALLPALQAAAKDPQEALRAE